MRHQAHLIFLSGAYLAHLEHKAEVPLVLEGYLYHGFDAKNLDAKGPGLKAGPLRLHPTVEHLAVKGETKFSWSSENFRCVAGERCTESSPDARACLHSHAKKYPCVDAVEDQP